MKNFLLFSFVSLTMGGLGLMAAQSLVEHPTQHSGTQRVTYYLGAQELHEQCLAMGNSRSFCDPAYNLGAHQ